MKTPCSGRNDCVKKKIFSSLRSALFRLVGFTFTIRCIFRSTEFTATNRPNFDHFRDGEIQYPPKICSTAFINEGCKRQKKPLIRHQLFNEPLDLNRRNQLLQKFSWLLSNTMNEKDYGREKVVLGMPLQTVKLTILHSKRSVAYNGYAGVHPIW